MKTYLLSLQDAVATEMKGAELLEKTDKVVLIYSKGKDTLSISVHEMLTSIKCKVEFSEVSLPNAKSEAIMAHFAYLSGLAIGQSSQVALIDTTQSLSSLDYLGLHIYPDIATAVKGQKKTRKTTNTITIVNNRITVRKPRKDKALDLTTLTSTTESVDQQKKDAVSVSTDISKQNVKKGESRKKDIKDLKQFLATFETKEYAPQNHCMAIYEGVKNSIKTGLPVEQCIADALIVDEIVVKAKKTLTGHYNEIKKFVSEM